MTRKQCNKLEKESDKIRVKFLNEIKKSKAKDYQVLVEKLEKQLFGEKKSREVGQMSKTIRERNTRSPVLKATITDPDTNEMVFTESKKS